MKNTNIILTLTIATVLTGCTTMEKKSAVENTVTPARAYVAAPGNTPNTSENKWVMVAPTTNAAAPANLGAIEPAAGPGATAQATTGQVIEAGKSDRNQDKFWF